MIFFLQELTYDFVLPNYETGAENDVVLFIQVKIMSIIDNIFCFFIIHILSAYADRPSPLCLCIPFSFFLLQIQQHL